MFDLFHNNQEKPDAILLAPPWIYWGVGFIFAFMIVLMGLRIYMALLTMNVLETTIYGGLQYGFLISLLKWHRAAYLKKSPQHKGQPLIAFTPSEQAMSFHHITGPAVYFLQDIDVTGYVKIGRATNPYHRLRDFGIKLPFTTRLIHIIECDNEKELEAHLHYRYDHKRIRGEWFALTKGDIDELKAFHP